MSVLLAFIVMLALFGINVPVAFAICAASFATCADTGLAAESSESSSESAAGLSSTPLMCGIFSPAARAESASAAVLTEEVMELKPAFAEAWTR